MILGMETISLANEGLALASIKSFLDCCKSADAENLWYLEGRARQLLLKSRQAAGQPDLASREAKISEQLLRQAPVPGHSNHKSVELAFSKIKSDEGNHWQKLSKWVEFLDVGDVKRDFSSMQSGLLEAADVAASILKVKKDPNTYPIFWHLQNQAESYLEQRRNLFTLYLYHSIADDVHSLYGEEGAILRWHNDFRVRYPQFNLRKILNSRYRKRKEIYERLKDWDNLLRMAQGIQQCLDKTESPVKRRGSRSLS